VKFGPPFGVGHMLRRAGKWVAALGAADASLGDVATALVATLARAQPKESAPRLVHGAFHDRNVLDLGDGPGVIDWQRFGQGPAEIEAGKFLAAVSRLALDECLAPAAAQAEGAFLDATAGLLDERALAWHRAAALLSLADRLLTRRKAGWLARAHALLARATQLTEIAA
jgi:aminoglycoside phosphotransferase (APT) family kinase protein